MFFNHMIQIKHKRKGRVLIKLLRKMVNIELQDHKRVLNQHTSQKDWMPYNNERSSLSYWT